MRIGWVAEKILKTRYISQRSYFQRKSLGFCHCRVVYNYGRDIVD
jgi:hypothetical protein